MNGLRTLLRTAWNLGIPSIARVIAYRAALRLGVHPVQQLRGTTPEGIFFLPPPAGLPLVTAVPVSDWQKYAHLFGRWPFAVARQPPDWHADPLSGRRIPNSSLPWWRIPDFDPLAGDIKLIWELSRMDWALAWGQRARKGDLSALSRLNDWLSDWCRSNPPYFGPNWKCGQEASIRVIHLALTAFMLGQVRKPTPALCDLVRLHLRRISSTLSYGIGQDNNHGTSEAAALFIGGSWLQTLGDVDATRWAKKGRRWLENRIAALVTKGGTFSQHSLNYHRLMLDTYSVVEIWRRHLNLSPFSDRLDARRRAAAVWLHRLIDPDSGDGPNLGANDGVRLLPLSDSRFRDYRPSVQLAIALFEGRRAYVLSGRFDDPLQWLGISVPKQPMAKIDSANFLDSGYAVFRRDSIMLILRYPCLRFRPSQADALHLDLWKTGDNILRDDGSYSYSAEVKWSKYFGSTAAHNTVQFDDRDQMPRLGRFLFGNWLRVRDLKTFSEYDGIIRVAAGYQDNHGARHYRGVALGKNILHVRDAIDRFQIKAVLRWRLSPRPWRLEGCGVTDGANQILVEASVPIVRCELVAGWESRHYLEKTLIPVLEIEVRQSGILNTYFHLNA